MLALKARVTSCGVRSLGCDASRKTAMGRSQTLKINWLTTADKIPRPMAMTEAT